MDPEKAKQFSQRTGSFPIKPPPKIPKIPVEIKRRNPELKEFWDAYDQAWETFIKESLQIQR